MDGLYYDVSFDSSSPETIGWKTATIPVLTHPTQNRGRFSIPNRDGELLGADKWSGNAFVTCTFHTRAHVMNGAFGRYADDLGTKINDFYMYLKDKKKLRISHRDNYIEPWSTDGYYEILQYTITNETYMMNDYVRIEVQFEVYPYKFYPSGDDFISAQVVTTLFDDSKPYYKIIASTTGGTVTLTVNDYEMTINVPADDNNVDIDTRRQIAFDSSKRPVVVSGDYTKLYIKRGIQNSIVLTGGALSYQPKWGYKL